MKLVLSLLTLVALTSISQSAQMRNLSVESRQNPLGVDVSQPRLSWQMEANARGARQSAYQVLVASSPQILAKNTGDLWDSRQVKSARSLRVEYRGVPLRSAQQVWWKVRVWDEKNAASNWSAPATWTMGLLRESDWQSRWIGAPFPTTARLLRGYHAGETTRQEPKWVQVDLGSTLPIQAVRLRPMLHANTPGFGFPVRFKIEASPTADFAAPTLLADQTGADFSNPGAKTLIFEAKNQTTRFVRVTATQIARHPDGQHFAFALSGFEVVSGGQNVAVGAAVSALDSTENFGWGRAALTDGSTGEAPESVSVLMRREFAVKSGLRRAVAFVCGLGHYEMTLNGAKVGRDLLAPGWTNYRKTALYDAHDITSQLRTGENALGLMLGNGMYHVPGGRYSKFVNSFGPLKARAQIRLEYRDGSVQIIGSDGNWRAAPGPVTFSDVFGGEDFDARREPRRWNRAGFDDSKWRAALPTDGPGGELRGVSVANPPIRAFETFKPVAVKNPKPGVAIYDLGQNAAMIPRLRVRGASGGAVRLVPAELLKSDGTADQKSSGGPSFWQYTLRGEGIETYFSPFFYRGFRYLQVEVSAPNGGAVPVVESLEGVVVHADSPVAGTFTSSSELFNRTYALVRRAQISNMMSVMTDCPHREKLGWLEENHLNGPALRFNFDMSAMFAKMMNDIADSQLPSGLVPSIAPEYPVFGGAFRDSPEWGSALLMVAQQQHEFHGDDSLLRAYYEPMRRYVEYLRSKSKDHIVSHGLSDWYDIGPGAPGYSKLTPAGLTATAFYYQDSLVVAQTARMLGKDAEAASYDALAAQIRDAFNAKFFNAATHQYGSGSQAANAIPLVMGIAEPEHRGAILQNLVADVQKQGLTAGDVGYRYLLRALADGGRSDVIFAMNNQSDKPGYGYQLKMGATSLTEAWDANPDSSQNHFMLGQINEWFFHDLAGIQSDSSGPGFKKILIKPAIVGDLTTAGASYKCGYGRIESRWTREGNALTLQVSIPANTSATVWMPTSDEKSVRESGKAVAGAVGVKWVQMEGGAARMEVGAGSYSFSSVLAR